MPVHEEWVQGSPALMNLEGDFVITSEKLEFIEYKSTFSDYIRNETKNVYQLISHLLCLFKLPALKLRVVMMPTSLFLVAQHCFCYDNL